MKCIVNKIKVIIPVLLTVMILTACSGIEDIKRIPSIDNVFNFIKTLDEAELYKHDEVVSVYDAEAYNRSIYRGTLLASEYCVTASNVSFEGEPDSNTIHAAALFDVDSRTVDYAYNVHERLYPASTTKILTALVALENSQLTDVVTVNEEADYRKFAKDEQVCGVKAGDTLTMQDLLYGMILGSGNDNAAAIAYHIAGSMEAFADMMNEKAAELRATNSHFVNSNGLHNEDHYTTAYDLYLIFNECIKHDEFIQIIQTTSYVANITSADGSVRQIEWNPSNYYQSGKTELPAGATIIGGKTGTTDEAGNCLILLLRDEQNHSDISIVMGAATKDILYQDMTTIINYIPNTN